MKTKTAVIISISVVAVGVVAYMLLKKKKEASLGDIPARPNSSTPSTPAPTDTRLVGTNKHGKKWLCNDFEVRNGEWWVKSLDCKVKDCFATHYLTTLNNLACK